MNTSAEATVTSLKAELERCLAMYKDKREQLAAAQEEVKTLKVGLDTANTRTESMQEELKAAKVQGERGV